MSHFVITGATGGSTQGASAPNRLEINVFVKNEQFFSLYIQALQAMQQTAQTELTSFFQIGGIHGLPYVAWDAGNANPVSEDGWQGYCVHGSVLFPTWHRPYMMLYEQVLQRHAITIANTYTVDRAKWQKAAADLRQPYWDWASNSVPPPEVISLQQVTITKPDGSRGPVPNPLFSYRFHPVDPSFAAPYSGWRSTLRQPATSGSSATSNVDRLTRVLRNAQPEIRSKTFNLLSRVRTWPAFSNHTVGDGGSSSNSLEAIHDDIHVEIGGIGHMSDPSVAAFDPIFFLHHANVDRLLSLWAAVHPGVWVTNGREDDGSFTIPPNSAVGPTTGLTPFRNSQTTFWPSSGVTGTAGLGYTYPEFNGLDTSNPTQLQTAISRIINRLYGGSAFTTLAVAPSAAAAPTTAAAAAPATTTAAPPTVTKAIPLAAPSTIPKGAPAKLDTPAPPTADPIVTPARSLAVHAGVSRKPENPAPAPISGQQGDSQIEFLVTGGDNPSSTHSMYDWTVRACFKKYELGTSFSILFFLGPVPEDSEEWLVADTYVGAVHAFVNSAAARCANCRQSPNLEIEGFVHLDEAIASRSHLNSFDPDNVVPYLKENLHWRVQKGVHEPVELPSLEVTVIGTPLSLPPGAVFPVGGEGHRYHSITRGRRGGSRHVDA